MYFEGPEDETRALTWMSAKLNQKRRELGRKRNEQLNMVIDLLRGIKSRINAIKADYAPSESEFHDLLWDRFIFAMTNKWIYDQEDNWECPFVWGEWVHAGEQELTIGHSDCLLRAVVPRGGGSAKHYYKCVPDEVHWVLTPLEQKGMVFFIGKAKVSEIDAVCSVPQLPAEMESSEAGKRVLDKMRGATEWQRRVEANRITSIRNFIEKSDNIIANSAILFGGSESNVSVSEKGDVRINFKGFLEKIGEEWCDHRGNIDNRPIWLIDGQHRTRGLAQSSIGIDVEIPIIYFPPQFNLGQAAKIFAEINTLQKKLSPLHTLFMQHRFGIPSPTAKRDFKQPWNDSDPDFRNSRANHLSYECAAYLSSNEDGPLFNRIKILDSNSSQMAIIKASQWVDFSRGWFGEGSIYEPNCGMNQQEINIEVENYFTALVNTCNHLETWEEVTGDKRQRWCLKANPKGLIQRHGPSMSLLKLYPTAWSLAKEKAGHIVPIPVDVFEEVLSPLKWVDWLDHRLRNTFHTGGERGRNALRIWMEDAIMNGVMYGYDEVMTEGIHSEAGKGILSSPGDGDITVVENKKWPYPGKPLTIRAKQPYNTLPTSQWTIIDSKKVNRSPENPGIQATRGVAEFTIRSSDWQKDIDEIEIRVDWRNMVSPPGKGVLVLKKPKS